MLLTEAGLGNVSRDITEIRYLMDLINRAKVALTKNRHEKLKFLRLLESGQSDVVEKHPILTDSTIDNWMSSYIIDCMSQVDLKIIAFRASYGFEFEPQYIVTEPVENKSLEYE